MSNFFNSRFSYFAIDDTGGTLRDLSPFIEELSEIPGDRNLVRVTALGASGETWTPGLENGLYKMGGFYHSRATTGPDAVLGPLRTHTSAATWEYGPEGSVTGRVKYSGTCWVKHYSVRKQPNALVRFLAVLQVEGAVTRGVFS